MLARTRQGGGSRDVGPAGGASTLLGGPGPRVQAVGRCSLPAVACSRPPGPPTWAQIAGNKGAAVLVGCAGRSRTGGHTAARGACLASSPWSSPCGHKAPAVQRHTVTTANGGPAPGTVWGATAHSAARAMPAPAAAPHHTPHARARPHGLEQGPAVPEPSTLNPHHACLRAAAPAAHCLGQVGAGGHWRRAEPAAEPVHVQRPRAAHSARAARGRCQLAGAAG